MRRLIVGTSCMPPRNPFRQTAVNPFRAPAEKEAPSANFVARELGARRTLDTLMAVPSASGEIVADALNFARAGVHRAANAGGRNLKRILPFVEPAPTTPSLRELYEQKTESEGYLQSGLRNIPRPRFRDAMAATASIPALLPGGETPSEAFDRNLFEIEEEEAAMRAAHPTAATVGDIAGDVGSLLIGRRATGADRFMRRAETRLSGKAAAAAADTLAKDMGKILKGPNMQRLGRAAGRSLETGIEAAALDILKDENADPLETAAVAAGGQLAGSTFLGASQGLMTGGLSKAAINITVAAASTWGLLQVLKSSTPGGEDRILESMESGYDKVAFALAAGVGSAALGATRYGRGNTNLSEQTRAFLDGVGTAHRGTTLSLLTDWTEGSPQDRAAIERVLTAMASDPHYQGETDAERSIVRQLRRGAAMATDGTGGGGR